MWKYRNCRLLVWLSVQVPNFLNKKNCNVIIIIENLGRYFEIFKPCLCQNQMYVLKFLGIVLFDVCNGKKLLLKSLAPSCARCFGLVRHWRLFFVDDIHVLASRVSLRCTISRSPSVFVSCHTAARPRYGQVWSLCLWTVMFFFPLEFVDVFVSKESYVQRMDPPGRVRSASGHF